MNIVANVILELEALAEVGITVTAAQLAYPAKNEEEIEEFYRNGMSISDIADLVQDLA